LGAEPFEKAGDMFSDDVDVGPIDEGSTKAGRVTEISTLSVVSWMDGR
jgi:hypothetical protein